MESSPGCGRPGSRTLIRRRIPCTGSRCAGVRRRKPHQRHCPPENVCAHRKPPALNNLVGMGACGVGNLRESQDDAQASAALPRTHALTAASSNRMPTASTHRCLVSPLLSAAIAAEQTCRQPRDCRSKARSAGRDQHRVPQACRRHARAWATTCPAGLHETCTRSPSGT